MSTLVCVFGTYTCYLDVIHMLDIGSNVLPQTYRNESLEKFLCKRGRTDVKERD